jgi:hypothetical protein
LKRFFRDLLRSQWVQRALGVLAANIRLVWLTNCFSYARRRLRHRRAGMPSSRSARAQHFMTPFIKKESHRARS